MSIFDLYKQALQKLAEADHRSQNKHAGFVSEQYDHRANMAEKDYADTAKKQKSSTLRAGLIGGGVGALAGHMLSKKKNNIGAGHGAAIGAGIGALGSLARNSRIEKAKHISSLEPELRKKEIKQRLVGQDLARVASLAATLYATRKTNK